MKALLGLAYLHFMLTIGPSSRERRPDMPLYYRVFFTTPRSKVEHVSQPPRSIVQGVCKVFGGCWKPVDKDFVYLPHPPFWSICSCHHSHSAQTTTKSTSISDPTNSFSTCSSSPSPPSSALPWQQPCPTPSPVLRSKAPCATLSATAWP